VVTGTPSLRALDAIHVASARLVGDELDAFVTYDARQAQVATAEGLRVISPGLTFAPE
jgi:predicted nucleic acid-binding protein